MKTIRKGIFETNSSSVHTLVIAHDNPEIPKTKLYFSLGEFGWGPELLNSVEERASYLWTYIIDYLAGEESELNWNDENFREDVNRIAHKYADKLSSILSKYDIECEFDYRKRNGFYEGYIDHSADWNTYNYDEVNHTYTRNNDSPFEEMLRDGNEQMLIDYLFSDKSQIEVINDNDDYDNMIKYPDCEYDEYRKGN